MAAWPQAVRMRSSLVLPTNKALQDYLCTKRSEGQNNDGMPALNAVATRLFA